ncbi:MAG: glycosyltransferase family 39 protein [Lewinellaceae bacterium]|nr:glycosyltransferase family 39 protein [Lewinellaceae bacterium]
MTRKTKRHAAERPAPRQADKPGHTKPATTPASPPDYGALAAQWAPKILLLFLTIGLLLRVLNISELSLWMDEYVHVMRAKGFLEDGGPLLTDDNNGILLTLALLPGFVLFGSSVFWARFPSVLFGAALVYVVYRVGTRLFNRYVGLFAAGGSALSLYLIFWSRVCRNYAPLSLFFLLLGLVFLMALEAGPKPDSEDRLARAGISKKHLWLLPVVGVLAFLSHQLTFFFVFSVGVYSLLRLAGTYWAGGEQPERIKFIWLTGLTLPLLLVVFIPPLGEVLKTTLAPFLLSNITEWAIPDWNRLGALAEAKPLEAFDLYHSLLVYDLNLLYIPALLGLVAAFWIRPRAGLWLVCSFVLPFLLLSFVFREPFLRRYLIFAYPYLLISAGVFFYALWHFLRSKVWPRMSLAVAALPFVLLLANTRWSSVADLALARKLEGYIVDSRIASWSFTNWEEACDYVNKRRRPGDVIMATVPTAVSYYMDHEQVLWFRQAYYDNRDKGYKLNAPNPGGGPSAASFDDLVRTVQQSPRGWLLADYYLENVFTDERALLWVYQNLHYYPEASAVGSIMVFGWDHALPKPERQNLVVEVGCVDNKLESREYHLTLPEQLFAANEIELTVRSRWVDSNREALVVFNKENAVWLPPNTGDGVEENVLPLQREWLRPGSNTIQVIYEPERPSDPRKGFTVYFLSIAGK